MCVRCICGHIRGSDLLTTRDCVCAQCTLFDEIKLGPENNLYNMANNSRADSHHTIMHERFRIARIEKASTKSPFTKSKNHLATKRYYQRRRQQQHE